MAALRAASIGLAPGQNYSSYTWDQNTYFDLSGYHFYHGTTADYMTFSGLNEKYPAWQRTTGFDAHSTYAEAEPTGQWVYVRPNKYEPKRANITIYNWSLAPTVSVDLSRVLNRGDHYVIQDAQNFYGPSIVNGTYTGLPVSIRMTGLAKAMPVGFAAPPHTAPQFGTFIVLPVGAVGATSGAPR
jgi:hypothetical protein